MSAETWVLCRDCVALQSIAPMLATKCLKCQSTRVISNNELTDLAIAHVDCDSFYASVEKRDNPKLQSSPVVVGGGNRGVVAAACYVARLYGVRSAMPMYKALELCPKAEVVAPNMRKYRETSMIIRQVMLEFTDIIQPLSLDEAYLDLTNTSHDFDLGAAQALALLLKRIENRAGITASAGLSYNKFLAKTASDVDKPKGYFVINRGEAVEFLSPRPIALMRGVGRATTKRMYRLGIETIGDLQEWDKVDLVARFGVFGNQLYNFAHAIDDRPVHEAAKSKSISAETTFFRDRADSNELLASVSPLLETVIRRLARQNGKARTVTLKLRTIDFQIHTRSRTLAGMSDEYDRFHQIIAEILTNIEVQGPFRLVGVGLSGLNFPDQDDEPDLWQD